MAGFRLLPAAEVDGELHQLVETTATVVGCGACDTRAVRSELTPTTLVRGIAGEPAGAR